MSAKQPARLLRPAQGSRATGRARRLLETLLPRLALDLTHRARDLGAPFPGAVDDIRLEIGFGGGEHLVAEAERTPAPASSASSRSSTAWPRRWRRSRRAGSHNVRLHYGDAVDLLAGSRTFARARRPASS